MSFLGFRVDLKGNLLDPRTEEIIQERLMTRHLRTGLDAQGVDFDTDFESYSKYVSQISIQSEMEINNNYNISK